MDTVYDKSYIGENQTSNARGVTPSFSTNDNQFDINQTQFANDFLCLNDKAQEMFLRKLVNSGVSVGNNTVIDVLFNKYCLGLGAEEKKSLARSLIQARLEGSGIKKEAEVNVDKRSVVRHTNVTKKVVHNKNVSKKQIKPEIGKSTLANVAKLTLIVGSAVWAMKLYNGLIVGSLNGKKVDGVNMGWLAKAYRNLFDSMFNTKYVETAKNKAAAQSVVQGHCDVKIGDQGVCEMAQSVDSSKKLKDFVKKLTKINKESDTRGFLGKIFKPAPQQIFNVSKGEEVVKEVAKAHENVKKSPLYQGVLRKTGFYDMIPSKLDKAIEITSLISLMAPFTTVLGFIPVVGPILKSSVKVIGKLSGPLLQFIKYKKANEVK